MSRSPDTLQPADTWRRQAACRAPGLADVMFPSSAPGEVDEAKRICHGCAVRTECGAWAIDKRIEHGVWGGMSETDRRAVLRRLAARRHAATGETNPRPGGYRPPAPCGTNAAYDRHIRKGEVPDDACRAAHAKRRAALKAAQIEAAKCGTRRGYQKHRRNGETACDACRKANADADRRLRNTGTTKAKAPV
ncbi:WhiB family transcriptional regulator [Streptomyces sp. NPDC002346]